MSEPLHPSQLIHYIEQRNRANLASVGLAFGVVVCAGLVGAVADVRLKLASAGVGTAIGIAARPIRKNAIAVDRLLNDVDDISHTNLQKWLLDATAPQHDPIMVQLPPAQLEGYVDDDGVPVRTIEEINESANGFIVCGNSGAGKSSTALYLAAMVTQDKPHQVIVLDPHAKKNHWHKFGLQVISDFEEIGAALTALRTELENRMKPGYPDDTPILVIWDEFGSCCRKLGDDFCVDALKALGQEGRKFNMPAIVLLHNEATIPLKDRKNYGMLYLCECARSYAEYQAKWKNDDPRRQWIDRVAYGAIATGSIPTTLLRHPTHGHHQRFRPTGNAPGTIPPINVIEAEYSVSAEVDAVDTEAQDWEDWQLFQECKSITGFAMKKYGARGGAAFHKAKARTEELKEKYGPTFQS